MTEHISTIPESNHLRTPQISFVPRSANHPYHSPQTQPQFQTAGARSTRMIIESASYETTPSESPPNEYHCVFNAQDCHHNVPPVAALAAIDQSLSAYSHNGARYSPLVRAYSSPPIMVEDVDKEVETSKNGQLEFSKPVKGGTTTKKEKPEGLDRQQEIPELDTREESGDEIGTPDPGTFPSSLTADTSDGGKLKHKREEKKNIKAMGEENVQDIGIDVGANL
ncbi:hypothetical protein B7463_g11783, partial [Scytalidium lignicola]